MSNYVIAITRGFGSGGRTVGKMLSTQLDIPYYDNEIIRLASEESGINEKLFGQVDEKLKNSLLKLGRSGVYKDKLIPPDSSEFVSDDNLFNYQAEIIKTLADKGSCIIVGRCADFVLRDRKNVVKLFVFADKDSCVKNVVEMYGVSEKKASKMIDVTDGRRSEYYKYYTAQNWENARNYDLSLNSAELGYQKCVKIVKDYIKIRFGN